jgi:hypothetical protein
MHPRLPCALALAIVLAAAVGSGPALGAANAAFAGEPIAYYLPGLDPAEADFDPAVPTPEDHLGWPLGTWHVQHAQVVSYFQALAAASDRIALVEYARSHEGKPLFHALITAPENHARLEEIRQEHLRLADPAQSARLDLSAMPLVAMLGYGIHGNEPSATNSALAVAFRLVAARDAETRATLRDTIVLLDPCLNPDGHDRFAQWVNSHRGRHPSADPADREHNEVWPRGRSNHYWFDLNRDWLPLVHPESRGRVAVFHRWKPNLLTDHHEMGTDTTYFFQPGIPGRDNPSIPPIVRELTARIAERHAAALDQLGSLYYARETFDDFYAGKGSTYPDLNGAVGILFEQASSRGHVQDSIHGTIAFPFTIRNQVATSFSSLRAARALRQELLEHQRTFFRTALEEARRSPVQGWVFDAALDPARAHHLLDLLRRHDIEVRQLARPLSAGGRTWEPGAAWVVPAVQPQFRFLTEMFTRRSEFEDTLFYDVSAWSVALGFDLPHAELNAAQLPAATLGDPIGTTFFPAGRLAGVAEAYAYVFDWTGFYAPRALQRLHAAGLRAKVATEPFSVRTEAGPVELGRGAIIVPVGLQPDRRGTIEDVVAAIAREDALTVHALSTGLSLAGPDLGSPTFHVLTAPKVALLVGEGVNNLDAGEVWHLLDTRVNLPLTMLDIARPLPALDRYTTLVLVDGSYGSLPDSAAAAIKSWLQRGGVLLASGRAVDWVSDQDIAKVERVPANRPAPDAPAERVPYGDGNRTENLKLIRGAIFGADLDLTHPLGFGFDRPHLNLFRTRTTAYRPSPSPYQTPAVYRAEPLLAGYASSENIARLAGSAALLVVHQGRGVAVLSADNLNFRGYWHGGSKAFLNGLFFGPSIRPIRTLGDTSDEG